MARNSKGVTIHVDGRPVYIARDAFVDDLTDAEYAELDRACEAKEHPEGACPLCADLVVETQGTFARESRDYVSDLWGDWTDTRGTFGSMDDDNQHSTFVDADKLDRLVRAHKIVRAFVDTFATGSLKFNVTFDESIATAGTDLKAKRVVISPAPALDPTLDPQRAGTILTAMALHESSHVRYGRNTAGALERVYPATHEHRDLAQGLLNILDDVRIERRLAEEYPGFAHVFAPTLDYVAESGIAKHGPWAPKPDQPVDLACAALRYPTHASFDGVEGERDWWQAWGDKWSRFDSPAKTMEAVREGVEHALVVIQQQPKPESQQGQGQPGADGDGTGESQDSDVSTTPSSGSGSATQDAKQNVLDALREALGLDDDEQVEGGQVERSATDPISSSRLPTCVADAIEQAALDNGADPGVTGRIAEQAVNEAETLADGGRFGKGEVRPAREGTGRRIRTAPDASVEAAVKAAFMRSRTGHTAVEHGHTRGTLDDSSLPRVAFRDVRVFQRRRAPSPQPYNIWLLVDCSSSMQASDPWTGQTAIEQTIACAKSIARATRYASSVRMRVLGWTSPSYFHQPSSIIQRSWGAYPAWRTGEPENRIDDLGKIDMGGTPDAPVVHWATDAILAETTRDERAILFVLTDGHGFSGLDESVKRARSKGVEVVGVAIGSGASNLSATYGAKRAIEWKRNLRGSARRLGETIADLTRPVAR